MSHINYTHALILDDSRQRVLLVKNGTESNYYWSFPGGQVEASETLEQAVIREVREETGYTIQISGLYSVREAFFTSRGHHALVFTFIAEIVGGEPKIADPDHEIIEAKWVDIHTANQLMPYIPDHIIIRPEKELNTAFYFDHGTV